METASLTIRTRNILMQSFEPSWCKEKAIDRLKKLCEKFNTDLYLLDYDFSSDTIEQIDTMYSQILSY